MDKTTKELLEAIKEYHSVEDCRVEGRFDCRLCASIKAVEQMRGADECQCMRVKHKNGTFTIYRNPYCVEHGIRQ